MADGSGVGSTRGLPVDGEGAGIAPGLEPRGMSRRQAIPLMGLAVLAVGACELELDPVANPPAAPSDDWLAAARIHRGGFQRFAVHQQVDGVAVRIEDEPHGEGDSMTVTIYQTDPRTGRFIQGSDGPLVLERYEGVTNAALSGIESEFVVFYYLE